MNCQNCTIKDKGWCRPLKQWQCENGIDNDEFIHLLILEISDIRRQQLAILDVLAPGMGVLDRMKKKRLPD
jgi:hypothetical protein